MRSTYEARTSEQIEIQCKKIMQGTATCCSGNFGKAWKGIFTLKAAEELAAATGHSIRAAGYQLSGECEPSAQSVLALIEAVTPKKKK